MNQTIILLNKRRDELVNEYNNKCKKLYDTVYFEEIDTLNKKINALQKNEMDELRKRYGED